MDLAGYPDAFLGASTLIETATKVTVKDPLAEILRLMDEVIFTPERKAVEEQLRVAKKAVQMTEVNVGQALEQVQGLYEFVLSASPPQKKEKWSLVKSALGIPIVLRSTKGALLMDRGGMPPYEVIVKDLE